MNWRDTAARSADLLDAIKHEESAVSLRAAALANQLPEARELAELTWDHLFPVMSMLAELLPRSDERDKLHEAVGDALRELQRTIDATGEAIHAELSREISASIPVKVAR